jgi:hypothetical protein
VTNQAGCRWRSYKSYPYFYRKNTMNAEVITLVDAALALTIERELFSSDEVANLLLDIRLAAEKELVPA